MAFLYYLSIIFTTVTHFPSVNTPQTKSLTDNQGVNLENDKKHKIMEQYEEMLLKFQSMK